MLIFRWTLTGVLVSLVADTLDVVLLDLMRVSDYGFYNPLDKILDTYLYVVTGLVAWRWKNRIAAITIVCLLVYRLIGVVAYEASGQRALLLVFPDLFIFYVLFFLLTNRMLKKDFITSAKTNAVVLILLLIPKMFQEYQLHVAQFPIYGWFREHILQHILPL